MEVAVRGARSLACVIAAVLVCGACRPVLPARRSTLEPASPEELAAAVRVQRPRCSLGLGYLFPGLGSLCLGKTGQGAAIAALAAAELTTTIVVARREPLGLEHPGAFVPFLAFQDLWVAGVAEVSIERALAERALYAPRDQVSDLVLAPFNGNVLRRPAVWLGTLGLLGAGIVASLAVDESSSTERLGDDPNLFGQRIDRRAGYPLGLGVMGGLFSHVALAEESLFRGVLQSGWARSLGETGGWIGGSLVFGAVHAANALFLPEDERAAYLMFGVPFITAVGYLGWVYRDSGYALAPPVALHFWYDFLLSATFFVLDPEHSLLSASVSLPL